MTQNKRRKDPAAPGAPPKSDPMLADIRIPEFRHDPLSANLRPPQDDPTNCLVDPMGDDLIQLRDVPKLLPSRNGKRLHHTTVWRWAQKGLDGVRLETVKVGRAIFTSQRALDAFFRRSTLQVPESGNPGVPTPKSNPTRRRRAQQQASRDLEAFLEGEI